MNRTTYVLNFLGGSGIGKTTTANLVFGELKRRYQSAEFVQEYVKTRAWLGLPVGPFGQSIIYGNQLERESILYGKVDFIVTEAPLILGPVYQQHYEHHETIKSVVLKDLDTAKKMNVVHLNFLLTRTMPFDPRGRYETEETAKVIDKKVESFLILHNIDYTVVDKVDDDRIKFIADTVMKIRDQNLGD